MAKKKKNEEKGKKPMEKRKNYEKAGERREIYRKIK